jgi:hypothetical protein
MAVEVSCGRAFKNAVVGVIFAVIREWALCHTELANVVFVRVNVGTIAWTVVDANG